MVPESAAWSSESCKQSTFERKEIDIIIGSQPSYMDEESSFGRSCVKASRHTCHVF